MDVKIVFIVVCYISQFFQTILASMVPMHFREVVGFCRNNGHKYLTIFDDGHAAENKKNILLMKQGNKQKILIISCLLMSFATVKMMV